MVKVSRLKVLLFVNVGVVLSSAVNRYFFWLTELSDNLNTKSIEVIHQLTAHGTYNAITQQKQIHFSPEHPEYEQLIQAYAEEHFKIIDVKANKNNV